MRRSSRVVATLPLDLQAMAREAYIASLHDVFVLAACWALLAYVLRLPVCMFFFWMWPTERLLILSVLITDPQIPDKDLDEQKKTAHVASVSEEERMLAGEERM